MDKLELVVPGDILSAEDKHVSGEGTHVHDNRIISSRVGILKREKTETGKTLLKVVRNNTNLVPYVEAKVMAKVTSITTNMVRCHILSVEDSPLSGPFRGILRKEEVRSTQRDKVIISDSYRPGDFILARVVSIADGQSCVLSTAGTDLGVIVAYSDSGFIMTPVSWTEMQCPETLVKYPRKVAKVTTEFIEKLFE